MKMDLVRADLHLHTTASDGTWTPQGLIEAAQQAGIGLIAVTDHESAGNVLEAERRARAVGLKLLPGVELSASDGGKCFHVLGYGITVGDKPLAELMAHNAWLLAQKDEDSIRLLAARGWPVSLEEYLAYDYDRTRGGWKALAYLQDKHLCKDVEDFFARIFTAENSLQFPVFPSIEEVIGCIHGAGGAAFLAHAASSFHGPGLAATLERLGEKPFDGFECYHSAHSEADTQTLLDYCRKRHRLISGGSDCHGSFVKSRHIGVPVIYEQDLELGGIL